MMVLPELQLLSYHDNVQSNWQMTYTVVAQQQYTTSTSLRVPKILSLYSEDNVHVAARDADLIVQV